jgi:hypothetical protein
MLPHKKALSRRTLANESSKQGQEERLIYFQHFLTATLRFRSARFGILDFIALCTIVFDVFFSLRFSRLAGTTTFAHT